MKSATVPIGTLLRIKKRCDQCNEFGSIGGIHKSGFAVYKAGEKKCFCRSCARKANIV